MNAPVVAPDLAPGLERCFWFDAVEDSYKISAVDGRVPAWLHGTYYVNGPGLFERSGQRYRHWLDGDGMVCALRFGHDGISFTSRFIRTRKWREEQEAGRFLYRGFGTAFPGDRLRRNLMLEPAVNVSVYPYAGTVLAFGEQSLPMELDPSTLETRGEYDFHGRLNEVMPFAAHAKFDGHLLNFGVSFSAAQPMLNVYEFTDEGHLLRRARHPLSFPHALHDFGFSREHVAFFLSPLGMSFQSLQAGASVMDSLRWEPDQPTRILVAPRPASSVPEEVFNVQVGSAYCLHMINCYEDGARMVVDLLELKEPIYGEYQPLPDVFANVSSCCPVRYLIDRRSRTLIERTTLSYNGMLDFPALDPALAGSCYEDFWMLGISDVGMRGRKFFNELVHGNWRDGTISDIFHVPPGEYLCGEPVCAASPAGSGEAVTIVEHFQPGINRTSFWLFDAFSVKSGPIARLPLRHPIHPGFHASFAPYRSTPKREEQ